MVGDSPFGSAAVVEPRSVLSTRSISGWSVIWPLGRRWWYAAYRWSFSRKRREAVRFDQVLHDAVGDRGAHRVGVACRGDGEGCIVHSLVAGQKVDPIVGELARQDGGTNSK